MFFNETDVGIGVTGTYQGDDAELTGTSLVGKKSLGVLVKPYICWRGLAPDGTHLAPFFLINRPSFSRSNAQPAFLFPANAPVAVAQILEPELVETGRGQKPK